MSKRAFFLVVLSLLLSFSVSSSYAELVAYYPMNETSGTQILDLSSYQRHAEAGDEPVRIDGPDGFGGALLFDGSNPAPAWVNCGTWNPSEQTGQVTCAFWVQWNGPNGNWQGVVAKRNGYDPAPDGAMMWYFEISQTGNDIFFGRRGQYPGGGGVLPTGEWQHMAASCDGATATIYVNAEQTASGAFTFGPTTDATILIGCDELNGYNGFNGALDEVRLYDTALSQQQIQVAMFDTGAPVELAFAARPSDGAVDVPRDVVLGWRAGLYADKHDVYFGTDADDVNEAGRDNPLDVLVSRDQDETSYDPPGLLDYNQTYYWRIDEVNDLETDSPWKGFVWSFTTVNFVVVDDFESYTDFPPDEIWNTWIDGFDDPTNGSTAGYPDPDFVVDEHYVETEIVNSGQQSMPLFYDNVAGLSEVTRTLTDKRDWTVDDVVTFTLFYYGDSANVAEPMYVAVSDSAVVTNDNANAALVDEWTRWDIPLQLFADLGVNLTNVSSLSIGFGDRANPVPGGAGMVFIDDIRLYRELPDEPEPEPEPEPEEPAEPVDPGTEGLIAYYALDGDVSDGSGNGLDGTVVGNPTFVEGTIGMAIDLNGDDYVDCGSDAMFDLTDQITVSTWVNIRSIASEWAAVVAKGEYAWRISSSGGGTNYHFGINYWQTSNPSVDGDTEVGTGEWHHVCGTYDGAEIRLYLDGAVDSSISNETGIGTNTANLLIGENPESTGRLWDGMIDEIMIYDRALSAGEVLFLAGQ